MDWYPQDLAQPYPVCAAVDYARSLEVEDLREKLARYCTDELPTEIEKTCEMFNRWIMERRATHPLNVDPLIPSPFDPKHKTNVLMKEIEQREQGRGPLALRSSASLFRELLNKTPVSIRVHPPTTLRKDQIYLLSRFARSYLSFAEQQWANLRICSSAEDLKEHLMGNSQLNEILCWLVKASAGISTKLPRLSDGSNISGECELHKVDYVYQVKLFMRPLSEYLWGAAIEKVCHKLSVSAVVAASRIRAMCGKINKNPKNPKFCSCCCVEAKSELCDDVCVLKCISKSQLSENTEEIEIGFAWVIQLRRLYREASEISGEGCEFSTSNFDKLMYCLVMRYNSLGGPNIRDGAGLQSGVPPKFLHFLRAEIGVTTECFASPFNCTLAKFYSMFDDIDVFFGSHGSFFGAQLGSGSYEINPPFEEQIMELMASRVLQLLRTDIPYSFAIVCPDWSNGPAAYLELLGDNPYLKAILKVSSQEHVYVSGTARFATPGIEYEPVMGSIFILLQNEAGSSRWPIRQTTLEGLKHAWAH